MLLYVYEMTNDIDKRGNFIQFIVTKYFLSEVYMGNKRIGYIILALSGLLLSIEIFSLKFLYLIQYDINTPQVIESPFDFLGDPPILLAVLITLSIFIFGLRLAVDKKNVKND